MRIGSSSFFTPALLLAIALPAFAALPRVHRGPTSPHLYKERTRATSKPVSHAIDSARATQIQTALVKSGYMTGTPSGVWDTETQTAMQKLQADNGWQTKLVPDSRAIIKLGLGSSSTAAVSPAPGEANEAVAEETHSEGNTTPTAQ